MTLEDGRIESPHRPCSPQKHGFTNHVRHRYLQERSKFQLRSCSISVEHKIKISHTEMGKKEQFQSTYVSPSLKPAQPSTENHNFYLARQKKGRRNEVNVQCPWLFLSLPEKLASYYVSKMTLSNNH